MPEIYPKVTRAKLKKAARKTANGKGRAPLPGVKTDAKHVDATDKSGQHFLLGWRLYPNRDHPRWKNKNVHSCGCGCGCSA